MDPRARRHLNNGLDTRRKPVHIHVMPIDPPAPLHPTQLAYVAAKSAYDNACDEVARRCVDMPTSTDEEFKLWNDACENARTALNVDGKRTIKEGAEDALLAWSFAVARRTASLHRLGLSIIATIDVLAAKAAKDLFARRRLLDLALRLESTSDAG